MVGRTGEASPVSPAVVTPLVKVVGQSSLSHDEECSFFGCDCALLRDAFLVITFRVSRRRREMYIGHDRLCDCVCLSVCPSPHSHTTAKIRM